VRAEDDALMDAAHASYLRASLPKERDRRLSELLRVSDAFIARAVRHFSRGSIGDVEFDDRMQEARLGFLEGVRRLDPTRGPLRPFCLFRIRHALQTLSERSVTIKIPRRMGLPVPIMKMIERIQVTKGRAPTREELNGSAAAYEESKTRPRIVTSFDATEGTGLHECFADDAPSALDALIELERQCAASEVGAKLGFTIPPRPRKESPPMNPSPLDSIVAQAQTHFEQEEAAIRALEKELEEKKKRLTDYRKKFASLGSTPAKPLIVAAPLLVALGQDGLQHKIMRYLREHPKARVSAIADAIGESAKDASLELARLRTTGTVTSEGQARGTTYSAAKAVPIKKSA
jgi:hypothetical protein